MTTAIWVLAVAFAFFMGLTVGSGLGPKKHSPTDVGGGVGCLGAVFVGNALVILGIVSYFVKG